MDEDALASILAATFRGTNEEVENATNELVSFLKNNDFPNIFILLIKNQKQEFAIRQSASIQMCYLISYNIISPDLSFCQEFANVIDLCEINLTPILKKCSNKLIKSLFLKSINPTNIIFDLLSQGQIKSSLFYSNSLMKIISNASISVISMYKSFTSSYIESLHDVFLSILSDENPEVVSLIFHFLARSTSYVLPKIFHEYSQLQFWFPNSMESFDVIKFDEYQYLNFLSNLPRHLFDRQNEPNFSILINELISWTINNIENIDTNNFDSKRISMISKILYKLIRFDLFQFDEDFFVELLKKSILPSFNFDNLIEENYLTEDKKCWKNLHDSSLYLFIEIIKKENQFLNVFYSLFESDEFIESEYFLNSLDLFSFCVSLFYDIDPPQFISFLNQLEELTETSKDDNNIKIVCLKIFSQIKNRRIQISPEFLLNSINFSIENIFNEDSLVCYFAALSTSSLIDLIENDENISIEFFESTQIIERMNDLIDIFFELEKDYQTETITASLMKIIFFFGEKIRPYLGQISNEVIELFFYFASIPENHQPTILLASIICKLIEISEGDPQFVSFLLSLLINEDSWSNIRYPFAFDKLFEILTSLIFYSTEFLDDFCQILPLLYEYLNQNDNNNHLFADISSVIEMLIWKKLLIDENDVEKADSILNDFLLQFLQDCDDFNEWILAASLSIKIESFSNLHEMNFILPKLLSFLESTPNGIKNTSVYNVVEHMFSYHSNELFEIDQETVFFLFYEIYILNAKIPSFIDSFLKCADSLPIEFKTIAFEKASSLVDEKKDMNQSDNEEEEEYDSENNNHVNPKWLDEEEILTNFAAFSSSIDSES